MSKTTRILLADDHKIVREGLRALLEKHEDLTVIAEAEDGREAEEVALEKRPDVVIMDIAMPGLNGIEATQRIVSACPNIRILALSMHSDKRFVTTILEAGARGYLIKDCAAEELVQAIRSVMSGNIYLSPSVAAHVVNDYVGNERTKNGSAFSVLSKREREVLQMLAEGETTKAIASELGVSAKTVETHRTRLMNKLSVHSIAALTKYAVREGLTSLDH